MAYALKLPAPWKSRGWSAKIRDKERAEPPHVTVLFRTKAWRINLRTKEFMDGRPDPAEVPEALLAWVLAQHAVLVAAWDEMYPHNPVSSEVDDE